MNESVKVKGSAMTIMSRITVTTILLFFLSNFFWIWFTFFRFEDLTKTSFVTTEAGTFMVSRNPDIELSEYEVGNFADRWLNFVLTNNAETLNKNLRIALEWIDKEDGDKLYQDYVDGQVLATLKKYDSRTELLTDSIKSNMSVRPAIVTLYGRQLTYYGKNKIEKPVAARFYIEPKGSGKRTRDSRNPYGLKIKKFSFIDYKDYYLKNSNAAPIDTLGATNIESEY